MHHSQCEVNICNHDSITGGSGSGNDSGKIVLALASPDYYEVGNRVTKVKATPKSSLHIHNAASSNIPSKSDVVDTKEIVMRSKHEIETVSTAGGNDNGSGKIVLALVSPSYYDELGTRITRVKATPTNLLQIHNTTSSNISGMSSEIYAEIVERNKHKREKVCRVGRENQLGNMVVTKGIKKKNIRQCCEVESGVVRVSPYFKDKLIGNINSSLRGDVDAHWVGNLIMRNEHKSGNNVPKESEKNGPKGDFLVKKNKRRKNNVQDDRLPHEHENQNALTSDGCQVESDVGISTISTKTKENKNKENKRKSPPSTVSLEGDSQVSTIRKVSPFFQSKTHEKDYPFVISSVTDHGVCTAEIDVEDGNDKNNMIDECVSYRKTQKPRNLKRKKAGDKKNHDLTSDVGQDDSDKMIREMSRKTKKKDKAESLMKCNQLKGQERELDACSAGSKKEDNTREIRDCPQGYTIKKVSPYFQRESQSKELNSDAEFHMNRPCRNVLINFEEVLSKYTYNCERTVRRDQENDSGGKKKKKKKQSTVLSAADKLIEPYRRKDPCNTWKPPRSPHNLLQEDHVHDPWRILVICMLLHITPGAQVKKVLSALFSLCPNAEAAVSVDAREIQRVIRRLGLQKKRADMIKRFSTEYLSDNWTHVTQLHGIGKYAADAYAIFCNGMWKQVTPNDHMLNRYWKFLKYRDFCCYKMLSC